MFFKKELFKYSSCLVLELGVESEFGLKELILGLRLVKYFFRYYKLGFLELEKGFI